MESPSVAPRPEIDLRRLFDGEMAPKLLEMEPQRKKAQRIMLLSIFPALLVLGFWYFIGGLQSFNGLTWVLALVPSFAVGGWGGSIFQKYRAQFKTHLVERLVETMFPGFDFDANRSITKAVYLKSELFERQPDRYQGEDFVHGAVGKTEFDFSEVHSEYKTESRNSKGQTTTHWHTIFKGIFFHADFHKHTKSRTFVFTDVAESKFGSLVGSWFQKLNASAGGHGKLVKLENVEFESAFVAYADDSQEARYILTPKLMENLVSLKRRFDSKPYLAFLDGQVFVALSTPKDHFEPRLFGAGVKFEDVNFFYETVRAVISIVDELDLNTRIWSKE